MFENGSVWRPPPLKNLRGKVMPPIMEIVKRGQLPQELVVGVGLGAEPGLLGAQGNTPQLNSVHVPR